ncbi:MAG: hypothetical protein NTZ77_03940 [Caldiserica bacterium]|nr:hypothetical protein [Caldisericota bacterium]
MRRLHYFGWKQRKGIALLLVMFIAFASLVLLTTLYSSLAPRAISVRGQAQSDRALAIADGTIDRLLDQINNTGLTYSATSPQTEPEVSQTLVKQLVVDINGGSLSQSYAELIANVRHYFYDIQTDTYYVLKNDGDPVATGTLTNLSTNTDVAGGLNGIDNKYSSDNRWFQLDANAKYWTNTGPDMWEIAATAFNMSNPDMKRTIRAEAQRGDITVKNGTWWVPKTTNTNFFSDYSGLYHSKTYFGRFEVVTGKVRSDDELWMGGWAKDEASAHLTVNDVAIDDGYRNDGRFGVSGVGLATAKSQVPPLAVDHVPVANWPNGDAALTTLFLQSKLTAYYVNSDATIVFSVDAGGNGFVTINGTVLPMPPVTFDADGIATAGGSIYVAGNATVSGKVQGKVTIGATNNIFIGGNIKYNDPPFVDKVNQTPVDPSLQDKLGLIAHNNIIIPVATYNANRTLEIDAAMLAVTGYFGIDANYGSYPSHNIISVPPYIGIWSGSQSMYSSASAPAWSGGSTVWGYEEQHTNYDWNLTAGARPPFFPAADDTVTPEITYKVYTGDDLGILQWLTQPQVTVLTSADYAYGKGMRYSYTIGATTYYFYGLNFNQDSGGSLYTGVYNASALYRVSWKEEIAKPVGSP